MILKVRLDDTIQRDDRFVQEWTITTPDGSTMCITSNSEWGDCVFEGENAEYEINGRKINAYTIIAMAIHGYGPTENGEERHFGPNEMKTAIEGGYLA